MQKTHIHFALKSYRQVNTLYMWHTFPQGGGAGGALWISSDRDD